MLEVSAARKIIVCLFVFGLMLTIAGHKYQAHRTAAQITWHDVNIELHQVEVARMDLFDALHEKIAATR